MKKIFFILFVIPNLVYSKDIVQINEFTLKELIKNNVPSIEKINSMVISSNLEMSQYNEKYSPFLNTELSNAGVNGKVFSNYIGGYDNPKSRIGVGVSQTLPVGIDFNVGLYNGYAKTTSFSPYGNIRYSQYDANLEGTFTFNLWKNFLGYSERAERLGLKFNKDEKIEQAKIETIRFYTELRKLYWSININYSIIDVYESLIKQAIIQEKNIRKMYRSSVADKGDLARATAVINTRKADLISIKYEIERAKQELSNLIPELNGKTLIINPVKYTDEKNKIELCLNSISQKKQTPFKLSSYYKLINYKNKKVEADLKSLERYAGIDAEFEAKLNSLGFGDNNGNSFEDMGKFKRQDYSIGLNIKIPLGSSHTDTKENSMKLLRMQYNYEKNEILSNLNSLHDYFSRSIKNLFNIREEQIKYADNLSIRVSSMRKKYNQGRVALSDLIQDEDSYFSSQLNIIQTNYSIVAFMLDYLAIFNDTPCKFNI